MSSYEQAQQDGVSAAQLRVQIRLGEDLGKVLLGEIANDGAGMAPQWDRQDLLALQKMLRHFRLYIAEKRMQGREAMVPGGDRGVPVVCEVVEERLHERRVDIGEGQAFQRHATDVAVGLDGVRAQIALAGQIKGQEIGHLHGEVGRLHGAILRGITSPKAALVRTVISGKSSAVRCR